MFSPLGCHPLTPDQPLDSINVCFFTMLMDHPVTFQGLIRGCRLLGRKSWNLPACGTPWKDGEL